MFDDVSAQKQPRVMTWVIILGALLIIAAAVAFMIKVKNSSSRTHPTQAPPAAEAGKQ